jgi:mRNA-degrading endonuclease RelE of RelBE toxin-antitoxin system
MIDYNFDYHPIFKKELNKLIRKCPSLKDDFKILKDIMIIDLNNNNYQFPKSKYHRIKGLGGEISLPAFKIKKFRCKSIKKGNRSGFRFTFLFHEEESLIYFVQIYHKSANENEDQNRIINLFGTVKSYGFFAFSKFGIR